MIHHSNLIFALLCMLAPIYGCGGSADATSGLPVDKPDANAKPDANGFDAGSWRDPRGSDSQDAALHVPTTQQLFDGSIAAPLQDAGVRIDDAGETGGSTGAAPNTDPSAVRIVGRQLVVEGKPFQIQGVCWNPVGRGGVHPADLDFRGFVDRDAPLMRAAGINAVRTYDAITDMAVLDALYAQGIYVLNTVYAWGGAEPSAVEAPVRAVKDHPAIVMWVLGNEWNYNGLYVGMSHQQSLETLNRAAALIRELDDRHPIATIYGEIPSRETVAAMPDIDIWGINAYRGLSFFDLFERYSEVSDKPMFLGEYGADAYDATQGAVNLPAQAQATEALTREILDHSAAATMDGTCLGGTLFEWADEWWKDANGSPDTQETGGIAPGGGPHPDQTFNEEWWGLVDIDRNPRPAYGRLKALYAPE